MKIRKGFVSNSSSSSFVIVREALSDKQEDMVIDYQTWIEFFIKTHNDETLTMRFDYYDTDPWTIKVYDDYIFGETSMDNFCIDEYFNFIKIDNKYIKWDEGYNDEPYQSQLDFIKESKQLIRKDKLNNIKNNKE